MKWPWIKAIVAAGMLIGGVSSAAPAPEGDGQSVPADVAIYGHAYGLELQQNTELARQLAGIPAAGEKQKVQVAAPRLSGMHYQGRLSGLPDSWVRLSEVGGRWQGIVSLSGTVYLIDSDDGPLTAEPVSSFQPVVCGAGHSGHREHAKALIDPDVHSALSAPAPQDVAFSSLCATTVDGVCLLLEVEFVFDRLFQDEFGDNARAQAESLINMTEGFYRNDFNIIFDTITLELLSSDVFSSTTDSGDLLDDIQNKKRNGQLGFVENDRALLHLVTGRNFDGDTAGVAFLNALCNRFGFGAGTSQLLRRFNGTPNMSLTALVVAHELGHNFGASHDGDGNSCDDSGFIMAPSVSPSASGFSSCSTDTIEAAISALSTPEACFNFPADVSIVASASNPQSATAGGEITLEYRIGVRDAFRDVPAIQVSGSVPAAAGRINSATLSGQGCTVASDRLSYQCSISNPQPDMTLAIEVVANTDGASFTQQVAVTGDSNIVDIDSGNDQLVTSLSVTGAVVVPAAASGVSVSQGSGAQVAVSWTDNSDNEDGFRIERRTGSGSFSELATVDSNATTYTDTTSSAGTSYGYRVVAFNSAGDAAASNIASITPSGTTPAPPPAPAPTPPPSGGGGGSMGWGWLVMAPLLWLRRRHLIGERA